MKISRMDAIKILDRATDQDDPYWEHVVDNWYDEENDDMPTIYDVFAALGVTKDEYKQASGADNLPDWPST